MVPEDYMVVHTALWFYESPHAFLSCTCGNWRSELADNSVKNACNGSKSVSVVVNVKLVLRMAINKEISL